MATAQASSGDMDTECCVCHDFFTEPKLLPCAHVVCRACLLSWLASSPEDHCPVCRRAVCHPKTVGSGGWEQVVDGLPTDVITAELVKAERLLSQDKVCIACTSPAVSICLHCSDMICRSCSQAHKKFSANRQHTIADLATMTPGVLAASQPGYCDSHPDKLAELFCPSHKKPICHVCASTKHRACPQPLELGEAAQKYREELKTKEANLKKQLQEIEKVLAQMVRGKENIEKDFDKVLMEIDKTYDRVVDHANHCRQQSKQQALQAKTKAQASLQAPTAPVLDLKAQLTSDLRLAVRSSNAATNKSIFDVSPMLESQVKGADVRATLSRNGAAVKRLTFNADPAVLARIGKDLSDLGSLHVTSAPILVKDLSLLDDSEAPAAKRPRQTKAWRFHTNHGQNIELSNDRRTARHKGRDCHGIVLGDQPMVTGTVYQIRLDQVAESKIGLYLPCGAVLADPDHLCLPRTTLNGWKLAAVWSGSAYLRRKKVRSKIEEDTTYDLDPDSRVGVVLDSTSRLHLVVDGRDQGVIAADLSTPCFPFFQLWSRYTQVTALPPTPMVWQ